MSINRRTFIGIALAWVSAPRAAQALSCAFGSANGVDIGDSISQRLSAASDIPASTSPGALLATLSDPSAASWLGRRYLSEHPEDQDTNRLVDQLWTAIDLYQGKVPAHSLELEQALISLIQSEYIASPLLAVDGWLLAPSEARLYALAVLATNSQQAFEPTSTPGMPLPSPLVAGC